MKLKTSELTGAALDWAVAKCEGIENSCGMWALDKWVGIPFGSNWAHGGPIVERKRIDLSFGGRLWWSLSGKTLCTGETPLIAAMRCHVTSELGDEVEVPEPCL
jgi:hypothetical protein